MSLNFDKLENVRPLRDGGYDSACPACRAEGLDRSGNHLRIYPDGAFNCCVHSGEKAHNRQIAHIAGSLIGHDRQTVGPPVRTSLSRYIPNERIPALTVPKDAQLDAIARQRGLDVALARPALRELANRGLLWIGELFGRVCWIITDGTRFTWRARRLDGERWETRSGSTKSLGVGKQLVEWPVGTDTLGGKKCVVFCEGEGDLLASAVIAYAEGRDLAQIGFVSMLGAVPTISPRALGALRLKTVLVMRQNDATHGKAARISEEWCRQLHSAGVSDIRLAAFHNLRANGTPLKDAGDYAQSLTGPTPLHFFPSWPERKEPRQHCGGVSFQQAPAGFCQTCFSRNIIARVYGPTCRCTSADQRT
jgi:hypothetical protein